MLGWMAGEIEVLGGGDTQRCLPLIRNLSLTQILPHSLRRVHRVEDLHKRIPGEKRWLIVGFKVNKENRMHVYNEIFHSAIKSNEIMTFARK